jgi:Glycosyl hydrolase family 57
MSSLPEYVDGLPNLSGSEPLVERAIAEAGDRPVFLDHSRIDFVRIRSACAIALHMHQPLTPTGGDDLRTAALIGNLQFMLEHPGIGDNHNATVFRHCYARMGEFIPALLAEGREPRVMLEYSGTLLHGLRSMGAHDVIDSLQRITCSPDYRRAVEWLGAPWGHAVAPSTPVQDFRLHVRAWQHHFAAIFGLDALARVRGFSPSEMALPNHPEVAYAFVRTLLDCGYQWVLVQEHTVEEPATGTTPRRPHLPHRLVCRNAAGQVASIVAIVKTQGSDSKLVAQMQPWYEAQGLRRCELAGHPVPPLVTQIADGENGGVMMNEFPAKYFEVVREASGSDVPLLNATEYLEHLFACGIRAADLPEIQPLYHGRIWARMQPGDGTDRLERVIDELRHEDGRFHVEGGSWTNSLTWVRGYDNVLGPMEEASALFHDRITRRQLPTAERRYRNALLHLLASQTSCYRYWGQGQWTDYGREICRRAGDILTCDY